MVLPGQKPVGMRNTYWENQTVIFLYPQGTAQYSQKTLDPVYRTFGDKSWLYDRTDAAFTFTAATGPNYLVMATVPSPDFTDTATLESLAAAGIHVSCRLHRNVPVFTADSRG